MSRSTLISNGRWERSGLSTATTATLAPPADIGSPYADGRRDGWRPIPPCGGRAAGTVDLSAMFQPLGFEGAMKQLSLAERAGLGKAARSSVPRESHAEWSPPDGR